jgi:hypothetical protein
MLELIWVSDPDEACNETTRRTRLWERCEGRDSQVSPFGIVFRSAGTPPAPPPFAAWAYSPMYLPPGQAIQVAEGTSLREPELFYLPFLRRASARHSEPTAQAPLIRRICGVSVGVPARSALSAASLCVERQGLVSYFEAPRPVLEILCADPTGMRVDLRPELPLVFRGV